MVKVVIILALFISIVYTDNEHDLDNFNGSNGPPGEIHTKTNEKNQDTLKPVINHPIEEKRITKPCKAEVSELLNNNEESGTSINKKDAEIKPISTDEKAVNKIPSNLKSNNVGNNDPTPSNNAKMPINIDLPKDTFHTRRLLPGIIKKPTKQELEDYKLYQNNPIHDEDKRSNSYISEKVKKRHINELPTQEDISEESIESRLIDPTIGKGIFDMKNTKVMLLENTRVCYACSTMSNPTCWAPDKKTTVKYCQKGHQSCLTKTFQHKGTSLIIRDCGSSCDSQNPNEKYSTCTTCHSDLCNGASTAINNTGVVMIVLLGIFYTKQ